MKIDGTRRIGFRYDVIRSGVKATELYPVQGSEPTVSMEGNGEIKLTMKGSFWSNPEIDLLGDRIRPFILLDGKEYPMGEYVIATVTENISRHGVQMNLEAYDLTYLVKETRIEEIAKISDGNRYTDVAQGLIITSGVDRILAETSPETIKTYREDWEIGTPHLTICNDLLSEINYNSLWCDLEGNLRITRYIPPTGRDIQHTYINDQFSVLRDEMSRETDLFDKFNVFRVVVSNPDYEEPMVAISVNDDPGSILSTVRRGRRVSPVVRLDNIASQKELQDYADNLKLKSMQVNENITFTTAISPDHTVGDVIALYNDRIAGAIYEEYAWSIPMRYDGEMTHKARRVDYK